MDQGNNATEFVRRELLDAAALLERAAACVDVAVARAAGRIAEALCRGNKLLLCGNGGSAADCQHLATEFVCRLSSARDRAALPALALTTDTSFLTACANDYGFDRVFARQIEALGKPGDVLLAISTSGNSANVCHAAVEARRRGLCVVALTGEGGGAIAPCCDVLIAVPDTGTAHVQEAHLAVEHALCALVERLVCRDEGAPA